MEKCKAEEEQLKRLETGEVVWKMPKQDNVTSVSLPAKPMLQVPTMPQAPVQSGQISQVPGLHPPLPQASFLPKTVSSTTDMKNVFANVGAPTVDLWTLYQPVVLLQTSGKFSKKKPYTCNKCGQCFMTKPALISHHSAHVTDKVSGCIGCGLLLSSKKLVPRFHLCDSPNNVTKLKIITAKPLNQAATGRSLNLNTGAFPATSSLELKSQIFSKGSQMPHVNSALQFKNQSMRMYNQGFRVKPFQQLRNPNLSASSPAVIARLPARIQSPNQDTSNKVSSGLPFSPSRQLEMPMNSPSGVLSKQTKTSATSGFICRVCHIPFETAQLLQRHKCIKAKEFMTQHAHANKHYTLKRVTPMASPNFAQINGERKLGVPASGNFKKNQAVAIGLNRGQRAVPVNHKTTVDMEDDCYIVESGSDKPAEMIYQVTSSVPIKT